MKKTTATERKEVIVQARKVLNPLWQIAQLRGRCWGRRHRGDNPFFGSNITIGIGDNIVSVSVSQEDGNLEIHEFKRAKGTVLGDAVKELLKKENLKIKGV